MASHAPSQPAHPAFARTDHRPWPHPATSWTWRQSWYDLLFLHWPVPAADLQRLVPPGLVVQSFGGTSWVGVVPFRMAGVMRRPWPDVPGVSAFPELNVRLYVEAEGKPGVWFLSLDATNPLAVWAARTFFHLPYVRADIDMAREGEAVRFDSRRRTGEARFAARYRPTGPRLDVRPGSIEHWMTERYCLYALRPGGQLWRYDVHHLPWPLRAAEAEVTENTVLAPHGLRAVGEPLRHASAGVDVVVWNGEPVGPARG